MASSDPVIENWVINFKEIANRFLEIKDQASHASSLEDFIKIIRPIVATLCVEYAIAADNVVLADETLDNFLGYMCRRIEQIMPPNIACRAGILFDAEGKVFFTFDTKTPVVLLN